MDRYKILSCRLFLSLGFLSALLLLSSCSEEKVYPDPDIGFEQGSGYLFTDTTLSLNENFKVGLSMKSNSDEFITHFNASVDRDGQISSIDTALAVMDYSIDLSLSKSLAKTEIWTFYCRDRDSRKSEVLTLTISLDTSSVFSGIKYIPSIKMGAQNNQENGSFYSLSEDKVFALSEAFNNQESVNLAYYFDTIDKDANTISSPGANIDASIYPGDQGLENWTTKNTTRFIERGNISPAEFDACSNDSLIIANSFDFSTGKRKAKKLSADQVYAFITEAGQKGLFIVKESNGEADGFIEISLKMLDE